MIAIRIAAGLLLTLVLRLGAEQPTILPPPPSAVDQPGATATWSPGRWQWTGSQWSWCPGSWRIAPAAAPAGPRWIEGHWLAGADGMQWVAGHWQAAADDGGRQPSERDIVPEPVPPVASISPAADQAVCLDRPCCSGVVVVAPAYVPVCAPPPVVVTMQVGRPLRLPLPPLPPLPAFSHHGSGPGAGFARLALHLLDPLSLLLHHR